MIGFIFATLTEARPFLSRVKAAKLVDEPFKSYEFPHSDMGEDGIVLISGMGKKSAACAALHIITKYRVSVVVNAGICAAAIDGINIGEIYRVLQVKEENSEGSQKDVWGCEGDTQKITDVLSLTHLPIARLTTVDVPVFEPARKERIGKWGQLIDMEGAAVARVCNENRVPCYFIKGVSDLADHNGKNAIRENMKIVTEKIARELLTRIIRTKCYD